MECFWYQIDRIDRFSTCTSNIFSFSPFWELRILFFNFEREGILKNYLSRVSFITPRWHGFDPEFLNQSISAKSFKIYARDRIRHASRVLFLFFHAERRSVHHTFIILFLYFCQSTGSKSEVCYFFVCHVSIKTKV